MEREREVYSGGIVIFLKKSAQKFGYSTKVD
jgi:hypothetical protein